MTDPEEAEESKKVENQKVDYDPTKIDKEQIKHAPKQFWAFIKDILSIKDEVNVKNTISIIKGNIVFRGANVWILVCSIIIACIGLNNNSIPVIIGAMLISPLMGPIRGIGLGIGTNDFKTLVSSLINFAVMVGISFLVAWIYFLISPFKTPTAELEYRVHPQALDCFIGFFGGLAGIIAAATGDRSTVVPGVAIATALMPPMCTAAYGLAIGDLSFFFGAIYLFLLNTVFICLSTVITIRYLKFPLMEFVHKRTERKVKLYSLIIVLAIMVPSIWAFVKLVQENRFEDEVRKFVKSEIELEEFFDNVELATFDYTYDTSSVSLKVLSGYIEPKQREKWESRMRKAPYKRLNRTGIKLINNHKPKELTSDNFISKEMYNAQKKTRQELEESNKLLRSALGNYQSAEINSEQLSKLISTSYSRVVDSIECGPMYMSNLQGNIDTTARYIVYWNNNMTDSLISTYKTDLEKHIELNIDRPNSKFLHISSYGKE